MPARIIRPLPIKLRVPGSGTVVRDDPQPEMVLVSSVTAPFLARAEPHAMEAPVVMVMLVSARIFPANAVPVHWHGYSSASEGFGWQAGGTCSKCAYRFSTA